MTHVPPAHAVSVSFFGGGGGGGGFGGVPTTVTSGIGSGTKMDGGGSVGAAEPDGGGGLGGFGLGAWTTTWGVSCSRRSCSAK